MAWNVTWVVASGYTEELEARYRLRDRATGRVNGGWITESAVPASSASVTFGPVPADSDFDVAIRAISREKRTASDWNVVRATDLQIVRRRRP